MNKKDKETLKKHIVIKYAEELFDSIDFVDTIINKDDGQFYTDNNIIYKTR